MLLRRENFVKHSANFNVFKQSLKELSNRTLLDLRDMGTYLDENEIQELQGLYPEISIVWGQGEVEVSSVEEPMYSGLWTSFFDT